jgi:hypothetical protein
MSRKITEIPVPAFLKKYIDKVYGEVFILPDRLLLLEVNDGRWRGKWELCLSNYKQSIVVEMFNPSPRRMLAAKRAFEKEFYLVFFTRLSEREHLGLEVMSSLRSLMKDYRISEEDYSEETLYRLYYRHKEKKRITIVKKERKKEKIVAEI